MSIEFISNGPAGSHVQDSPGSARAPTNHPIKAPGASRGDGGPLGFSPLLEACRALHNQQPLSTNDKTQGSQQTLRTPRKPGGRRAVGLFAAPGSLPSSSQPTALSTNDKTQGSQQTLRTPRKPGGRRAVGLFAVSPVVRSRRDRVSGDDIRRCRPQWFPTLVVTRFRRNRAPGEPGEPAPASRGRCCRRSPRQRRGSMPSSIRRWSLARRYSVRRARDSAVD